MSYPINYFGRSHDRYRREKYFGIKHSDRFFHFYVVGKSGSGKTNLLKTKIKQDIDNVVGLCFFDPHGDAIAEIFQTLSKEDQNDIIYLDLTDQDIPWGYNPLRRVLTSKRSLVASSILDVFKRLWKSAWGMKMEHILRHILLTLLDQPNVDFSDINRLIQDQAFRVECINNIQNPELRKFWQQEFPKYKSGDLLPILSKTGAFLSHQIVRKILVENKRQISIRHIMDSRKVLLINLAKGSVGSDVANTVGSLLLTTLASASFSRIDMSPEHRVPFFIYLDEFQAFTNAELIGEMLSELRKFKVGLILSNQFLSQLDGEVRASVLGNVGTLVSFRLGVTDARIMSQEFEKKFSIDDFTGLSNAQIYLRMMIDCQPSIPFSADTILYPFKPP